MIPLEEAQQFVLASCPPAAPVRVALDASLGCVAAESLVAREPVPHFVNSSMDGYALRAADTEMRPGPRGTVRLEVIGTALAGTPLGCSVGPGQAARIMTGAPLPDGADAVCPIEAVEVGDGGAEISVSTPVTEGAYVRLVGQDVEVGAPVLERGSILTPARLGVLAAQGIEEVAVVPVPRIGVLSTGDELVEGPGPLAPGKIRDANRHTLVALVRQEGWTAVDLGTVGDDEEEIGRALDEAGRRCDAVVTSGGVSVGDLDVVKVVLRRRSAGTMRWMQVAIRPAKPFAFGLVDGVPVFGLPGNPVSAMVSFELFVRPAARRMSGHHALDRPTVSALARGDFPRRPDGKTHFQRALAGLDTDGQWQVTALEDQESHQLTAMADANALAVLPDGEGVVSGDRVRVLLLDPARPSPEATPHTWAGDR